MTRYNVGVRFTVNGGGVGADVQRAGQLAQTAGTRAQRGARGFGQLSGSFKSLRSQMGAGIGHLRSWTRSLFSMQTAIAGVLAVLGGQSLWQATIGRNAELEQTGLGMAAITRATVELRNAQGRLLDDQAAWQVSLKVGQEQLARLRRLAREEPIASTQELVTVFAGLQASATQAGASYAELEKTSVAVVNVAKVLKESGLSSSQSIQFATRDINQLLSGSASINELSMPMRIVMQRVLQMVGGFEQWNKLDMPTKFRLVNQELKRFSRPELIDSYAKSWNGLTDIVGEFADLALTTFGQPIFELLRAELKDVVEWLQDNQQEISATARIWGTEFMTGLKNVIAFGTDLYAFFKNNRELAIAFGLALGGLLIYMNPVGAALTGIVVGLGLLATKWNTVKPQLLAGWDKLPLQIDSVLDTIYRRFLRWQIDMIQSARKDPLVARFLGPDIEVVVQELEGKYLDSQILTARRRREMARIDQRSRLEQAASNPADPRLQYQAARQLADTQVQVTQYITTPDPTRAGNQAAQGVGRAVAQANHSNLKVGNPITRQPR